MVKKFHHDVWVGIILMLFSAACFYMAAGISKEPGALPRTLCVLMFGCACWIALKGVLKSRTVQEKVVLGEHKFGFLFYGFIFIYYLGFRFLGYWAVTPVFLILSQKWLKVKSWKVNLLITFTYMVVSYLLFVVLLKLPIYRVGLLGKYFRFG